jgi:hypothetical protein
VWQGFKTATIAVFKFIKTGPVNRPYRAVAEELGFVGTVRGRLPVGFSNRAGSFRPVTAVTDRFTAVL